MLDIIEYSLLYFAIEANINEFTPTTPDERTQRRQTGEKMRIQILNRWTAAVIFETEVSDDIEARFRLRAAVEIAVSQRVSLRAADLSAADLSAAVLRAADLSAADLRAADLSDADLRAADLSAANLSAADLRAANLRAADLSAADLSDADLSDADLSAADLRAAKNLTEKQLIPIRDDLWAVLSAAPKEANGLRKALAEGRVDGSTYEGDCACLVGTIANERHCKIGDLGILKPNSSRPIECWFMGIKKGDTPENNVCSKWALAWTDEWLNNMRDAFGN